MRSIPPFLLAAVLALTCAAAHAQGAGAAPPASAEEQRSAAARTEREIADLRRQLVRLGAAESAGERAVGRGRERLKSLYAQERALTARLEANRGELTRVLSALQNFSRDPPPALLVDPRSARDAVRAAILVRAITPALVERGRTLKAQAMTLQRLRRGVAEASGLLFQSESETADRRARIERLIAAKRQLERSLLADADRVEAEARALADRAGSMGALVGALPSGTADDTPPLRLAAPVQGVAVRRFGEAWPGHGRSAGWSWRALGGAQVVSPAAGRVEYAGPLKSWGGVVILRLGGDQRLVLSGLESAAPVIGARVAEGEPIGRLPAQGGPAELYVELRRAGAPVDPEKLFNTPLAEGRLR